MSNGLPGLPDFGVSRLFGTLGSELTQTYERVVDRHLRLAVTGLSRSGKTVFTTCLVHHLLEGRDLPFVKAVHDERYLAGRLLPVHGRSRFPFERFVDDLRGDPASWPRATEELSSLSLELRFRTTNFLLRQVTPIQTIHLEIIDYPGEWLLDLPLLEASFDDFSTNALDLARSRERQPLAQAWLRAVHEHDGTAAADDDTAATLASLYTGYLQACRDQLGFSIVQPGRFTNPGSMRGSTTLQFCPMPPGPTPRGSLRDLMARRYQRYRSDVIEPFYRDHFSGFDRQIVLVDLLASLNRGPGHFKDTADALAIVMQSFRYGERSLLNRLFNPTIDRILFAASKADHVAPSQHAAMKSLLEALVEPATRNARYQGLKPEVLALASLRCTDVVRTDHHGQTLSCVRGRLKNEGKETVLFPGEVPPEPPGPNEWDAERYRFREFAPRQLMPGRKGQHIRLDQAIEFLIGDKLQ